MTRTLRLTRGYGPGLGVGRSGSMLAVGNSSAINGRRPRFGLGLGPAFIRDGALRAGFLAAARLGAAFFLGCLRVGFFFFAICVRFDG